MAISIPRVISPSPLFIAALGYGVKSSWRSGIKIAYGHTTVALPLAILLGIGAISLVTLPHFNDIISILGAISLFVFATIQSRNIIQKTTIEYPSDRNPFFVGIFMTALNPSFFAWWFMVGLKLISSSLELYSIIGFVVMFASHIVIDYVWFTLAGFLSGKGKNILTSKNYRIFMMVLNGVLVYFGITFLLQVQPIRDINI